METTEKKQSKSNDLLAKITEHIEELAEATDAAYLSEQMQDYLEMCAQFHHYSPNNVWLIMLSCPNASMVAGFRKWKSMNRYVKKGEDGIPILAPLLRKKEKENGEIEKMLTGFRVVYVFDVSQTDGEPLPEVPNWKSPEKNLELQEKLIAFAEANNITIHFKILEGETQGVSKGGVIEISPVAGTKTIIHEIAHELLHQNHFHGMENKSLQELEAEGVAYLVAKHFGFKKLSSPNYLALHGINSKMIREHMERVLNFAKEVIDGIEY